jgi:tRNA(Ile2) C34 agmatinyltransferase TiaS
MHHHRHPIYACIDDTDMPGTRGTNRLAISIVKSLVGRWRCRSMTKHPHLRHPRIPYTHGNNSCCMIFEPRPEQRPEQLIAILREAILDDFIEGSDPGLCVATTVPPEVIRWGERSRREVLSMDEAHEIAARHGLHLEGLGGTHQGIIGALAGVGSAAAGEPGQYLMIGDRELDFGGVLQPAELATLGIESFVDAETDAPLPPGPLRVPKKLRPTMRGGRPMVFVSRQDPARYQLVRRD